MDVYYLCDFVTFTSALLRLQVHMYWLRQFLANMVRKVSNTLDICSFELPENRDEV